MRGRSFFQNLTAKPDMLVNYKGDIALLDQFYQLMVVCECAKHYSEALEIAVHRGTAWQRSPNEMNSSCMP